MKKILFVVFLLLQGCELSQQLYTNEIEACHVGLLSELGANAQLSFKGVEDFGATVKVHGMAKIPVSLLQWRTQPYSCIVEADSTLLRVLYERAKIVLDTPFDARGSFFWLYLVTFLIIGSLIYGYDRWRRGAAAVGGYLHFLLPLESYRHPSALVDYQLLVANQFLFLNILALPGLTAFVALAVQGGLAQWFGDQRVGLPDTTSTYLVFTLITLLARDFVHYVSHALQHFVPILWEIHKVHHTAEVLVPFTAARLHPLENFVKGLVSAVVVGPLQGVAAYLLLSEADIVTLFGVNAGVVLIYLAGSNLRHSHIWFSYGRVLSHLLISPAQHQVHHSVAPEHRDKNIGGVFAIWDWMFGTLYVPKGREQIVYGVAPGVSQEHDTLFKAWFLPLRNIYRLLVGKSGGPVWWFRARD